jgi:hypothetical protein
MVHDPFPKKHQQEFHQFKMLPGEVGPDDGQEEQDAKHYMCHHHPQAPAQDPHDIHPHIQAAAWYLPLDGFRGLRKRKRVSRHKPFFSF